MSSLYLTPSDSRLLKEIEIYLYYVKKPVELQFPIKVASDSRKMNWTEHKSGYGADPTSHYSGNGGREMSIKIEYIVESDDPDFTTRWNIRKVKENINLLKGIFTGYRKDPGNKDDGGLLVGNNGQVLIRFKYPLITGREPKTFRVSSVSVDYSDEIIVAGSSTFDEDTVTIAHPLKSTVTMNMTTYSISSFQKPNSDWEEASVFPTLEELWY